MSKRPGPCTSAPAELASHRRASKPAGHSTLPSTPRLCPTAPTPLPSSAQQLPRDASAGAPSINPSPFLPIDPPRLLDGLPPGCIAPKGTMPAGDNPHSISEKKAALRESPKGPKNAVNQEARTSPFPKDKAAGIIGVKRSHPNAFMGSTNLGIPGANGHLVYVRRRLETDQNKGGVSGSAQTVASRSSKKPVIGGSPEQSLKHHNNVAQTQAAPVSASPAAAAAFPALPSGSLPAHLSFGKQSPRKVTVNPSIVVTASPPPRNVVSTTMSQDLVAPNVASCNVAAIRTASRDAVAAKTHNPTDLQRPSNPDWKERFIRLQAFLRNNEQSGQDEYICMLHSLSPVGRSKHAFELEKRAVNLLMEEGKELQKMKVLNVLGKLSPTDHPSLPTQPTFAMRMPFKPFPARR